MSERSTVEDDGFHVETVMDDNAEISVLAAMVHSGREAVHELTELLAGPSDFANLMRRDIYMAVFDLTSAFEPISHATLRRQLETKNQFDKETAVFLPELWASFTTLEMARADAVVVADLGEQRRIRDALKRGYRNNANASLSSDSVLEQLDLELQRARHPDRKSLAAPPGASWQPHDLQTILSGEKVTVEPTVGLRRNDGLCLLYPGKEHGILGEMEAGKSWFAGASCAAELSRGNRVLYIHFEETDATDMVERIRDLGVPDEKILELFRFVGPMEPVKPKYLEALLDPPPALVILDGVNEAMALHGQGIREEDGAAAFRRILVKPCTSVGAAVLSCDHVVKDREARGRYGLGSIHKGNGLNGSLIMLENAEPFGRGQRGRSNVFITKDRPGQIRQHGRPTKLAGKTFLGSLVVDDTGTYQPFLDLGFFAPAEADEEDDAPPPPSPDGEDHLRVLAVVKELIAKGETVTGRAVRSKSPFGTDKTANALERLVIDGVLKREPGPRNSWIFTLISEGELLIPIEAAS